MTVFVVRNRGNWMKANLRETPISDVQHCDHHGFLWIFPETSTLRFNLFFATLVNTAIVYNLVRALQRQSFPSG